MSSRIFSSRILVTIMIFTKTIQFKLSILIISILTFNTVFSQGKNTNLLAKKYNEIAFLTTHNAFNSTQDKYSYPNQEYNITRQLVDGVRALMIDVYDENGVPVVYHSKSVLGTKPLSYFLDQIKDFLTNNPKEIVTIIFECYESADKIEEAMKNADLLAITYTKVKGVDWPTLQNMIETNKRLIVFSDKNDASSTQKWYHFVWTYSVETSFSVHDLDDFNSDFNRGKANNDLFILNHFITSSILGVGQKDKALKANSNPFLIDRITKCQTEKRKFPNFVTLDFYNLGDGLQAVNKLNNVTDTASETISEGKIKVFPNPMKSELTIELPNSATPPYESSIQLLDGKTLKYTFSDWKQQFKLTNIILPKGIYLLRVTDVKQKEFSVKIAVN